MSISPLPSAPPIPVKRSKASLLTGIILTVSLLISCTTSAGNTILSRQDSFQDAFTRAQEVIDAVNANAPRELYPLLSRELRNQVSLEEFVARFTEERAYPYLTPLYLILDTIDLSRDGTARIVCTVSSRLPGEMYRFSLTYEKDAYYAVIFEDVVNGSFREKFDRIVTW